MRNRPHVPAILKLPQILREMLRADVNVRPANAALQEVPEALKVVHMRSVSADILLRTVVAGHVPIAAQRNALVGGPLVGMQRRARKNVIADQRPQRLAVAALKHPRNQLAARFQHPEHDALVALVAGALALDVPANESLVELHDFAGAAQRIVAIERRHVLVDFVAHAPRGFVRHADIALDRLGGHAVPRRREQEHDKEPVAQRSAGAVERRSGSRIKLVRAPVALVGAAALHSAVLRRTPALGAVEVSPVPHLKQVIEAAILSREAVLELAKRCHAYCIAEPLTCFKGIYPKFQYVTDVKAPAAATASTPQTVPAARALRARGSRAR